MELRMKWSRLIWMGFFSCLLLSAFPVCAQLNVPEQLRCDLLLQTDYQLSEGFVVPVEWKSGKKESVKILSKFPAFGWNVSCEKSGVTQTAYQILVAGSVNSLNKNIGDLWDSGKVISTQSSGIIYAGKPLVGDKSYFWKVRIWDEEQTQSGYSDVATFMTDKELQEYATARYPIQKEQEVPVYVRNMGDGGIVADFGKAAFCGQLYLSLTSDSERDTVIVHLGEAMTSDGYVNRDPECKIRYYDYCLPLRQGRHTYRLDFRRGGGSIKTPAYIGQVIPFRYVELENYSGNANNVLLVRNTAYYPYNDEASYFDSSDSILNKVWDLCKYSVKATSFTGQFIDGDRERKPYEGDNYIGQLTAY